MALKTREEKNKELMEDNVTNPEGDADDHVDEETDDDKLPES